MGVENIRDESDGAVILLCDQPRLTPAVIDKAISTESRSRLALTAMQSSARLFRERAFDELLALDGDRGGKQLLEDHLNSIAIIPFRTAPWTSTHSKIWQLYLEPI